MSFSDLKHSELDTLAQECFKTQTELSVLNVCTTDGFGIIGYAREGHDLELDKVSAMASSLCAIGSSSVKMITGDQADIMTLESSSGSILFQRAEYADHEVVITLATSAELPLAHARFLLKRFRDQLEQAKTD